MYLSRLIPNPTSREFRRDNADIREMHRTIMSAYPQVIDGTPARQHHAVLWRMDATQHGFIHYVQSIIEPNWSRLPAGYLTQPPKTRPLQPVIHALSAGRRFSFRLTANPVREVESKKVPIRDAVQQIQWLIRQADQYGFAIPTAHNGKPDITATQCLTQVGRKRQGEHGSVTIEPVRFDGHLIVTDTTRFAEALKKGIGRAKAYGCGLLSLAPQWTVAENGN